MQMFLFEQQGRDFAGCFVGWSRRDEGIKIVEISAKIDYWKSKLLDVTRRNSLISYKPRDRRSVDISFPNVFNALDDLDSGKLIAFSLEQISEPRVWFGGEDKKLLSLFLEERDNRSELGIDTLFVGAFAINYIDKDGESLRAPLLLRSVTLKRLGKSSSTRHRYELSSLDDEYIVNPALAEKLSKEHDIALPREVEHVAEYVAEIGRMIPQDWHIEECVLLDIFNFQKYIIYQDLVKNQERVENSILVKSLLGLEELPIVDKVKRRDVEVMLADSSQREAISLAESGQSFVLQGPPGTGKSQTIANMIMALLEKDKKVLFVSQKKAALDVVAKRLSEVGFGRYCLGLHDFRGNKREIIQEITSSYEKAALIPPDQKTQSVEPYLQAEDYVSAYYEALGHSGSQKTCVYDLMGEFAKVSDVEPVDYKFDELFSLSATELKAMIDELSLCSFEGNPFDNAYFAFEDVSATSRKAYTQLLADTQKELKELLAYAEQLSLAGDVISNLSELRVHANLHAGLKSSLPKLYSEKLDDAKAYLTKVEQALDRDAEIRPYMLDRVETSFLTDDTEVLQKTIENTGLVGRMMNSDYKRAIVELEQYAKEPLGVNDWKGLFSKKQKLQQIENKLEEFKKDSFAKGISKFDLANIREVKGEVVGRVDAIAKVAQEGVSENILSVFNEMECPSDLLSNFEKHLEDIRGHFQISDLQGEDLSLLRSVLLDLDKQYKEFPRISEFKIAYGKLHLEMKAFVQRFYDAGKGDVVSAFLRTYYEQALQRVGHHSMPLKSYNYVLEHADAIRNVKRYKIIEGLEERKRAYSGSYGPVNIIKRESEKKRHLKPIRKVIDEATDFILALKPCFLMSPLTVSQYIDEPYFDCVIFDEASQILPEEAIPCLVRAKQAIVVGDTQQLPPTTFFATQSDADAEVEDLESFLSEASTRWPTISLRWHYRSENEDLITYSNRSFYHGNLITFPRADDSRGVHVVYSDGQYDRGKSRTNVGEAESVVELYDKIRLEHPSKSVGIIAFSMSQEGAIRKALGDRVEVGEQECDLFIKNLETVQGDERDVIILSVGYGKDMDGKMSYNFGPLNRAGGYKRLNVAISRSKFACYLVSSLKPSDFSREKIKADGVLHLYNFLKYAESDEKSSDDAFLHPLEEDVASSVGGSRTLVGLSSHRIPVAVGNLALDFDGSFGDVRDKDVIRPLVLQRMGWKSCRIWSDQWIEDKQKVMDSLSDVDSRSSESLGGIEEVEHTPEQEELMPYVVCELSAAKVKKIEDVPELFLKDKLREVVSIESPIVRDLVYERVCSAYSIKVGESEKTHLSVLLNQEGFDSRDDTIMVEKKEVFDLRLSDDGSRSFHLIPVEEIAGGILKALHGGSLGAGDVSNIICKEYLNYERVTSKMKERIALSVDYLVSLDKVEMNSDKIKVKN